MQISPDFAVLTAMKREFVVGSIQASQDGSPYVYVTFNDPKDYKQERNMSPFGPNVPVFTSPEDLMKNLPKVMGMFGGGMSDSPMIKFSMREYQDLGIKVGDKVTLEVQKVESSGV
jgi:hypothetical protein